MPLICSSLRICLIVASMGTGGLVSGTDGVEPGEVREGEATAAAIGQLPRLVRLNEPALTRG